MTFNKGGMSTKWGGGGGGGREPPNSGKKNWMSTQKNEVVFLPYTIYK